MLWDVKKKFGMRKTRTEKKYEKHARFCWGAHQALVRARAEAENCFCDRKYAKCRAFQALAYIYYIECFCGHVRNRFLTMIKYHSFFFLFYFGSAFVAKISLSCTLKWRFVVGDIVIIHQDIFVVHTIRFLPSALFPPVHRCVCLCGKCDYMTRSKQTSVYSSIEYTNRRIVNAYMPQLIYMYIIYWDVWVAKLICHQLFDWVCVCVSAICDIECMTPWVCVCVCPIIIIVINNTLTPFPSYHSR